jgi:hypothetical protein
MTDSTILGTSDILCQELDEIERRRRSRSGRHDARPQDDLETREERCQRLGLSALCLSGGGIRSAAFCLGVLQALAAKRLLRRFDYLSSVSGGGFIGGWLQVLMRELGGTSGAEAEIAQQRPGALRRLRAFTNYLTPQTGVLSVDTWAGIVLYLRNLLINWVVFAPLFVLLTLLPITYRTALWACSGSEWTNRGLLALGGLSLLYGVVRACTLLPSHRPPRASDDPIPDYASAASIRWEIVYPALGWTLLVPWMLDFAKTRFEAHDGNLPWVANNILWVIPITYFVLMIIGFGVAWWVQSQRNNPGVQMFRANFGRWVLASIGSALLMLLILWIGAAILPVLEEIRIEFTTVLAVFAPLLLAVVHVLQTSLYVALRHETELADLDREWLGRVNAMILRLAMCWTIFALCCLVLAVQIYVAHAPGKDEWAANWISGVGALTVFLGGLGAWLGKVWSSVEAIGGKPAIRERLRAYLPVAIGAVFAVCLLVVFSGLVNLVLAQLQSLVGAKLAPNGHPGWLLPLALQMIVAVALLCGVLTFRGVNVNRFSMHAVYRNRLVRAFLGSARGKREPEPFTGFDPDDNIPLTDLLRNGNSLFPVINMTLNITSGNNTAWGERKAAPFTATPLACGSAELRSPAQSPTEIDPRGSYVPTRRYAGLEDLPKQPTPNMSRGPGLGSALTVSGAAVSPNWGYHSSRFTAFLMTLFNVRLGVWLPNPSKATRDELRLARPRNSLTALISEMLGATTDDSQAIYLSDGGHFENLGLYEMLRRRCAVVLVVDAGADESCTLFDLGSAIRKAEIDFGITVTMREPMAICSRHKVEKDASLQPAPRGFATGTIDYGDGHQGVLLYLKPSFLPDMPTDVRSYGAENITFPHESTIDQWFNESQFESYRVLGRFQMEKCLREAQPDDLAGLYPTAQPAVVVGRIGAVGTSEEPAAAE